MEVGNNQRLSHLDNALRYVAPVALLAVLAENAAQLFLRPVVDDLCGAVRRRGAQAHVEGPVPEKAEAALGSIHLRAQARPVSLNTALLFGLRSHQAACLTTDPNVERACIDEKPRSMRMPATPACAAAGGSALKRLQS